MSADPITQVRDYLDAITDEVLVNEIVASPVSDLKARIMLRRGPVIAVLAGASVLILGAVAILVRPNETPPASSPTSLPRTAIVEVVVSGSQDNARFTVGLDTDGTLCAEAGSESMSQTACGGGVDVTAVAFQTDTGIALAGYAPASVARLTAVYDGDLRRPLTLTPVPGRQMFAFGTIEKLQPAFVEIEVVDQNGDIIKRYFPSIGPASERSTRLLIDPGSRTEEIRAASPAGVKGSLVVR